MKILNIKNSYAAVALFFLFAAGSQAQDYGALQHMLQKRPANEKFESNKFGEHLFITAGLGPYGMMSDRKVQDGTGITSGLSVGKWFTPVHGVRVGGNYTDIGLADNVRIKMMGGNIDYMLNMSSLTYGYNADRRFELSGIVGVEAGISKKPGVNGHKSKNDKYYGAYLGMQGKVRLSRKLDFFAEPRIGWYTDGIAHTHSWRNYRTAGSVMAGLIYTPVASDRKKIVYDDFENTSFADNMFFSLSGGMSTLKVPGIKNTLKSFGPQLSVGIGKWFSPYSALRMSATTGFSKSPAGSEDKKFKHLDVHADYMLNPWRYDPDRLFNLSGVIGLNISATKGVDKNTKYAPGIGVGLNGSFRISRSVDMFVEPRMNIYGSRYAAGLGYIGHTDQLGELNIGLVYHAVGREARGTTGFTGNRFTDNMFVTSGVGMQMLLKKTNIKNLSSLGPQFSVGAGKWFTPYSGVRLTAAGGYFTNYEVYGMKEDKVRHLSATGSMDYLWNITSTMSGYNPARTFELIGSAGVNVSYTSRMEKKIQPGLNFGIQGLWNINDMLGLFIEPQIRIYGDKFAEGNTCLMKKDVMGVISAGVSYRFASYSKAASRESFDNDNRHYFVSGALGACSLLDDRLKIAENAGMQFAASFGRWFTPLSAWRVNGNVVYNAKTHDGASLKYYGLGVDYMLSIAALAKGYASDNVFDIVPFIGVNGGFAHRRGEYKVVPGFDAGAQLKLKINSVAYLFAEPKIGLRTDKYDGLKQDKTDRTVSVMLGLQYKLRHRK